MPAQFESERLIPHYEVTINGNTLSPEQMLDIYAIELSDEISAAAMFELHVNIWDAETQELKWIDEDLYKIGSEVTIKMGYVDDFREMMVGEITGVEPEFSEELSVTMAVRGYDRLHRLSRGRQTRSFKEMKDSQITEQVAQEYNLTAQVEDTRIIHPYVFQNNLSNLDFLLRRAHLIGYELSVDNKTLVFRKSKETDTEATELIYGQTLLSFYPRMSSAFQLSEVEARLWDPKEKKEVISSAGLGDESTTMAGQETGAEVADGIFGATKTVIGYETLISQAEAENVAGARFRSQLLRFVSGEGTCIGTPDVKTGNVVKISAIGERFSGLYYITASTHTIDDRGYRTSFYARRNAI